jgi:hypothetical protein
METMPRFSEILTNLETISDLIADAIVRKIMPVKDDITEHQAKRAYGSRWIQKMKTYGLAKESRVGCRIIYSRAHLNALRAAEREYDQIFLQRRANRNKNK